MNLKDAFRAQNKLQALMDEAGEILQDRGNTLKVTTTHRRSGKSSAPPSAPPSPNCPWTWTAKLA